MSKSATHPEEPRVRLTNVETLLQQAIDDLVGSNSQAPGVHSSAILTQACTELQHFAGQVSGCSLERAQRVAIEKQLKRVLTRLALAERLLTGAAEFYRGWCAVGFAEASSVPGYENAGPVCGPALLAFEG